MSSDVKHDQLPITEKILLTLAFGLAGYITRLCFRSPNPPPRDRYAQDRLIRLLSLFNGAALREHACTLFTIAHIVLLWTIPQHNTAPSFCSHPKNVNAAYFHPTPYVLGWLFVIYLAGALRLTAFATLGPSFTFELARPRKLVTTGIYAHVQHPSYPPDFLLTVANLALLFNWDGVAGCVLPSWLVDFYRSWKWPLLGAAAAGHVLGLSVRIADEERMLSETFGQEWEAWHRRTARFVPGLL